MKYTTLTKLSLAMLATVACGTAMAQNVHVAPGRQSVVPGVNIEARGAALGGNLVMDACTGCNFDSVAGGYYVLGTSNCEGDSEQWIAVPFYAAASTAPRQIMASIDNDTACTGTSTQVTLSIYSDSCPGGTGTESTPGTALVSGKATVPNAPCALATAALKSAPALVAGTKYWVVASTAGNTQVGLSAVWYASNTSLIGGDEANGGWFSFSGLVPGFMVQ